ncbi:MAG: lytic murein transglycosylase [Bdellovibrio sp. ArHS]|uniref:LysM peptidoglycan-binding domain-containing protein n=1 Tax=Bdellovibrio sp. ArHS TaxID=1569284 RepID=UPI0005839AD8|nr:LysM peptidoglycan-binding domain-containing protein [Bdellovibrio sp. ArHS]KHD89416.1 MAG: lytic murein transglycosylase [Bdellovibrio sp. ArHS]
MRRLLTLSLVLAFMAGCAHKGSTGANGAAGTRSGDGEMKDIGSFRLSDPEGPKVVDQELESIPTEVNPLVEKWIAYFQGRGRPHMERYLARSTRYEKLMKKVLRDNGLPEDLFYIALIESGFSSKATSHASAVGYWQFIRGTGKRYGLDINAFVDERRDPVFATQAAAEYFKGLYSVFGSWYLAMASYNVGENRVKREVMNHYTRDFWELARKRRLPAETINYVPKFIAAKLIAKEPDKYGFGEIDYLPPIEFDHITLDKPVNLRAMADKLNLNYEDFKALNPKYKGEVAPVKGSELVLRIPPGTSEQALIAANESVVQNVQFVADSGDTQVYRIRQGDTLSTVARRYRTTVAYLRDLNDLPRRKPLRVGMRIQVPDRTPLRSRSASQVAKQSKTETRSVSVSTDGRYYIVQSGDSLFTIARKYSTSVSELQRLNQIKRGRTLKVGMKIRVPTPDSSSAREATKSVAKAKAKVHVVKRGENLLGIAERYNVSMSDIKEKNKIRNPSSLMVGARILIPVAEANQ